MASLEERMTGSSGSINLQNLNVGTLSNDLSRGIENTNSLESRLEQKNVEEGNMGVSDLAPVYNAIQTWTGKYEDRKSLPDGWSSVPKVPTPDNKYEHVVYHQDKPNVHYTINTESNEVFERDISDRGEIKNKRKELFQYEETGESWNAIMNPDFNMLATEDEIILKHVPSYLKPFVQVTAKTVDGFVVKPALGLLMEGIQFGQSTIQDAGTAFVRAVRDNVIEGSTLDKIDKSLYKWSNGTLPSLTYYSALDENVGGRSLVGDIGMLIEGAEAGAMLRPFATTPRILLGGKEGQKTLQALDDYKMAKEKVDALVSDAKRGGRKLTEIEMQEFLSGKKLNINKVRLKTHEYEKARENLAAIVAGKNQDIAEQLITEFEEKTGTIISKTVFGKKAIDFEKTRGEGTKKLSKKYYHKNDEIELDKHGEPKDSRLDDTFLLKDQDGDLTSPILNPDKFNKLISVVADLKAKNPKIFGPIPKKKKKLFESEEGKILQEVANIKKGKKKQKKKTLIDQLFELTVKKDLLASDELAETLSKYGVSFEDYILMVVGSGSKAGQILNKLSQMKRVRSLQELKEISIKKQAKADNGFRKAIQRIENIRRGGLVGTLATAARNFESALIRSPTEGLVNMFETSVLRFAQGDAASARRFDWLKNWSDPQEWKDSFRHLQYIFSDRTNAEDYTNFILENPEFAKQITRFYDMVSEIRQSQGKGTGGKLDLILGGLEDVVDVVNTPNRWQDYVMRRAIFLAEIQRLGRRDMGIDVAEIINNGRIRDLINNAPDLIKNKKGPKFLEIVNDATEKALDLTYGSAPKIQVLADTANFITRNGLTVAIPFPRFMFKAMELMGEYTAGMPIAMAKYMVGKSSKYDATMVARNIVGWGLIGAAAMYRNDEDAPAEYNKMKIPGQNALLDTMPIFPLGQVLYLGEAARRMKNKTFDSWFDVKEFTKVFTGTNFRAGMTGEIFLRDLSELASSSNIRGREKSGKALGRLVGNYAVSLLQPFSMIIDASRTLDSFGFSGFHSLKYRDVDTEPDLTFLGSFGKAFTRPFKQRGFVLPSMEREYRERELSLQEGGLERIYPVARLLGGFNITTGDTPEAKFIKKLGLSEYDFRGKTKVGSIDNAINETINDYIPTIARKYMKREERLRAKGYSESYIATDLKARIYSDLTKIKTQITRLSLGRSEDTTYINALFKFISVHKDLQNAGIKKFEQEYGIFPDITNYKHLLMLHKLAIGHRSRLKF